MKKIQQQNGIKRRLEKDMSDIYLKPFVQDALEELEKGNFFDNYDYYNNVDNVAMVRLTRQPTNMRGERTGTIQLKKLESLKTKKAVKEELHYLMEGNMPELNRHPIGKKLNQLWKLIDETTVMDYERKERQKEFVDKMRHFIRHKLYPIKYTKEEIVTSKILDYPSSKNNLKDCNEIYNYYMKKKKTMDRINGL
ncbi:hypothetical protein H8D04_00480 [bacterium]|nr:hypothetical protein [bacterium]